MSHRHNWELSGGCRENPGVHSSGGSVVIASHCHCGAKKRVDYWNHEQNKPRKVAKVTVTEAEGVKS